ncbi:MAG: HAMP domain-containing protein, partial [Anaerolineae bacterium]|nr:HAMP domain-containing protein [Anaerolineae bacterium]
MQMLKWRQWSLTVKLTLSIIVLVVLVVVGLTLLSIQREQQNFRTELQQQAELVLNTLIAAQVDDLYTLNATALQSITSNLGTYRLVTFGRVYDREGRVVADAYDTSSVFQPEADPVGKQLVASNDVVFDWQPEQLIAGKSAIVGRQRLGAISIGLSTAPLQIKMNSARDHGLITAFLAAVGSALLALVLSRSIIGPLRRLTDVAKRISGGDLSTRAAINSQNEIGQLALAFNNMLDDIQKHDTERTHLIKDLQAAKRLAEENSRLKSEFLSTMSHELRTPMNAIEGFTSIMLSRMGGVEFNEKTERYITRVNVNSKRLLQLINDFLDLSRVESGRLELAYQAFSPADLARRWQNEIGILAEKKNIGFELTLDPHLPETVYGDDEAISKVAINLLGNAIKFTEHGKVSLSLSNGGENWRISVTDTGIGIP